MEGRHATKEELIEELERLRQRISTLEESEARLRETELLLRENEKRFRLLYENAPLSYQSLDKNGNFLEVNQAWLNMLGYSRDEVIGKWCGDFLTPGYRDKFSIYFPQFKETGAINGIEFEMMRKDGTTVFVAADGKIGRGGDGQFRQTHCILRDVTDRKKAEKELQRSNDLLRAIIDAAPIAIIGLDLDGNVQTVWNRAAEKMLGWSAEEAMGRPLPSVPQEGQDEFRSFRERIRSGKSLDGVEVRRRKRDGTPIDYSIYASPLHDDEGNISGNIAVLVDMRERKRSEAVLRESEERFRTAFETHPDAITLLRLSDLTYADVNDGFAKLSGYEKWEVIGKSHDDINIFFDPDDMNKALGQLNKTGHLTNFQTTFRLKDGRIIAGLLAARTVAIKGIPHLLAIARDIEEWKRAEDERSRLITAIEQAAETVVITDIDGNIVYANPAFEQITGYSREEVIGRNPRILKSGQHDEAFYHDLWETISSGRVWTGRFVNKKRDDSLYEEEATISPIKEESGRIVNYVAVKRDVTHEVLLQKQFLEAQKMEAIGTLAGGVAHDFNNLLQVILGYVDIALLKRDLERSTTALQEIQRAARSAAELAQGLLTFGRRAETKLRPVDLNHELRQSALMLKRTIPKMIEIEMNLSDDLHTINADPRQLQQIVLNLAVNARDAMPDRGKIIIETENVFLDMEFCNTHLGISPGHHVLLTFSDTGSGMDKETCVRIFEPFFTTKESGKGTGLGLSVVFGIVKSHGGNILCYSEPGAGTTFRIYLPALMSHRTSPADEPMSPPAGGNETILLVDDEKSIREMTESLLESFGYTVLKASNGREALDIFAREHQQISLIILDLIMPEMSGRDCLRDILRFSPETKVIIASGYGEHEQIDRALEEGAKASVRKPYDMRKILQAIRDVLDRS